MNRRRVRPPKFKNQKATSEWFKNVGKSLGYVTTGTLVNLTPGISASVSEAKNVIEDYKDPVKTFLSKNTTMQQRIDLILGEDTTYIDIAKDAYKNLKDDLKSGKFHNKDRSDAALNKQLGLDMDFGDFDVDMDFGDIGDDSFEDTSDKTIVTPNINITSNISGDNPMVRGVEKQIETTLNIAKAEEARDKAIAKVSFGYLDTMNSNMISGLTAVNANLTKMIDFNNSVVARAITSQTAFYESGLKFMEDMLTEVKKITSPEKKERRRKELFDVNDIFMSGSSFELGGFISNIKRNMKKSADDSFLAPFLNMLSPDMLSSLAASPLTMVLEGVVGAIIPASINTIMGRVDKAVMSFLPAFTKKLADWGRKDDGDGLLGWMKKQLGQLLGVTVERKRSVDLGAYEKEAVPFDGITRRSIIEVIPGYLSKILAALTKGDPVLYDYNTGKFKTISKVKKDFHEDARSSIVSEFDYDVVSGFEDVLKAKYGKDTKYIESFKDSLVKFSELDEMIDFRKMEDVQKLFGKLSESEKRRNPILRDNEVPEDVIKMMVNYFSSLDPSARMQFSGLSHLSASQQFSKILQRVEDNDSDINRYLFNNFFDDENNAKNGRRRGKKKGKGGSGGGPNGGGPGPTPEQRDLEYIKELLRQGKNIPPELADVVLDEEARELIRKNEEKKKEKHKFFKGDNPIAKFLEPLIEKPMEFLNTQANKLETVLHDIIFGPVDEDDKDDSKNKGSLIERLKNRLTGLIDDIREKLFGEEGFFTRLKNSDWYKNVTSKIGKLSDKFLGVKGADGVYSGGLVSDTVNSMKSSIRGIGRSASASAKGVGTSFAGLFGASSMGELMTNGLDYLGRGFASLSDSLFGRRDPATGEIEVDTTRTKISSFLKENLGDMLGKGAVGAGVGLFASATTTGLLSSLMIGPIGGAAIGIGASLLSKSDAFKELMFGKEDEDGNYIEGLISKKTQDFFKNNKNALAGTAVAGGIAGGLGLLPGFLIGGPVGGALFGLAGGILYKSESFQNFMFGDDGVASKIKELAANKLSGFKDMIPSVAAGSLAGMGAMALFGLNPVLGAFAGAGVAIASKTELWSKFMFGDPENSDSRGVAGKAVEIIGDKLIDPLRIGIRSMGNSIIDWFEFKVKLPIMDIIDYGVTGMKHFISDLMQKSPLSFIAEKFFDPIKLTFKDIGDNLYNFTTGLLKKSVGVVGKLFGKIISAPIGFIQKITIGVVEGFFRNSVLREVRAPFEELMDDTKQQVSKFLGDVRDDIKAIIGGAGKGIFSLFKKIGGGMLKGFEKVTGIIGIDDKISNFKTRRAEKAEQRKQATMSRLEDIRAGLSSRYEGQERTKGEKFKDYIDSFNPFSSLRKYAAEGFIDEKGNSVFGGLLGRSADRKRKAEEEKKKRDAEFDRLKDKISSDKFKDKFFKKNVKGFNNMTDAEKAIVKETAQINADTSDILNIGKELLSTIKEILDAMRGKKKDDGSSSVEYPPVPVDNKSNAANANTSSTGQNKQSSSNAGNIQYPPALIDEKSNVGKANMSSAGKDKTVFDGDVIGEGSSSKKQPETAIPDIIDAEFTESREKASADVNLPGGNKAKRSGSAIGGKIVNAIGSVIKGGIDRVKNTAKVGMSALGTLAGAALIAGTGGAAAPAVGGAAAAGAGGGAALGSGAAMGAAGATGASGAAMGATGVGGAAGVGGKAMPDIAKNLVGDPKSMMADAVTQGITQSTEEDGALAQLPDLVSGLSDLVLPIAAKAGLITLGAIGLFKFFKDPDAMLNGIEKVFDNVISPLATKAGDFLKEKIPEFVEHFVTNMPKIMLKFGEWFGENYPKFIRWQAELTWEIGKSYVTTVSTNLREGIDKLPGLIGKAFNKGLKWLVEKLPTVISDGIKNKVKGAANKVKDVFGFGDENEEVDITTAVGDIMTSNTTEVGAKALGTDKKSFKELSEFTRTIAQSSNTVNMNEYWNTDKVPKKYGPIGTMMFKVSRLASLPGRMINETLNSTNDELTNIEHDVEEKKQSFGERFKSGVSGLWNAVKEGVTGFIKNGSSGSTTTTSTTTASSSSYKLFFDEKNRVGGGEIGIGKGRNNYYSFSTNSSALSDVNFGRTLEGGISSPHKGIDILVNDRLNREVKSTTKGTVVYVGRSPIYGNMVQIRDDNGMYHMYGHLSSIMVSVGDTVTVGTTIGIEGSTGQSSGSHVHYEVGSGYTPGSNLLGRVHPGEYVKSYSRGGKISATPIEQYKTGSYWSGNSSTSSFRGIGGDEDGAVEKKEISFNTFLQPFSEFANSISGVVSEFLGTGSSGTGIPSSSGASSGAIIDASGKRLGDFVKQFESGSKGSATISSGSGDAGGASFGTYQFASKYGGLKDFWNKYYASQYPGVTPGNNQAFKDAWLSAVEADPEGFANNEHAYMMANFYTPFINKSSNTSVINPNTHSRAAQEIAWSTAIQYGVNSNVWRKAISNAGLTSATTPADLVNAIQDYKTSTVSSYFGRNRQDVQDGVRNRHNVGERNALLSVGDAPALAIGGGEIGIPDRFHVSRRVGGGSNLIFSNNTEIVEILKTIVGALLNIETNTKTTSTNINKIANNKSSSSEEKPQKKTSTSSRNRSIEIAEQRRKEKYKVDYEIASAIAKGN